MSGLAPVIERLKGLYDKADDLWGEYVESVKAAVREWELSKLDLLSELSELKAKLESDLKALEELKLKVELGLVDKEKAEKKIGELESEVEKLRGEVESLWVALEEFTLRSLTHSKRAGLPLGLTEEDVASKQETLKKAFERGVIGETAYNAIRSTLEQLLELLHS
ncbi:hypothetical protein [Thermofilum pendens]|uniref:Uncharacterized protein n=1 Tax=Thermofilum pendens (strain DSM 2475 / Hrk 5) TaxID=368408 RepID=A1RY52_THEPD|nr:hypothetical protein [Thermofilum pendens]ABL78132.1 conserved hypothetical protein [Thermofilum pendens Hrk 5]